MRETEIEQSMKKALHNNRNSVSAPQNTINLKLNFLASKIYTKALPPRAAAVLGFAMNANHPPIAISAQPNILSLLILDCAAANPVAAIKSACKFRLL